MFRHNARLRKRRPSSPPVFGRGGEKPPPLPKWEGRREASCSPPIFGRGSRDAQVEQARAGERAAGQRAGVERGGGAPEGDRVPRPRPARGRGPAWSGGGGRRRGTGSRAQGPRGAEGRRGAGGGGAGGGPGPAPKARAGQRAGVERGGGRRRGTGSRAQGPRGAEGRRGAGGHFIGAPERDRVPLPAFSAGRRGASRSPPHEAPAAWSPAPGRDRCQRGDESQGIAVKGLLCPLRYPGSDLGRLRMIWRPHAVELPRARGHSAGRGTGSCAVRPARGRGRRGAAGRRGRAGGGPGPVAPGGRPARGRGQRRGAAVPLVLSRITVATTRQQ